MKYLRCAGLLAVAVGAAAPTSALAYIDPNTGGWLFQLLFPLMMAIAGTWGLFKRRIAGLFRRWTGRGAAGTQRVTAASGEAASDAESSGGNKIHD